MILAGSLDFKVQKTLIQADVLEVGARQGWLCRPRGAPGQGPEGSEKAGRVGVDFIRTRPGVPPNNYQCKIIQNTGLIGNGLIERLLKLSFLLP